MRLRRLIIAAGMAGMLAGPLAAQQAAGDMPESYRVVQGKALELQRRMLLAMVDSMPERLYRDKATPAQRDFAGQIQHAVQAVVMIGSRVLGAAPPTTRPDTAAVLNTRAGMRDFVNSRYDWAAAALKAQTDRSKEVDLFGSRMPAWQVWDEIHQHTVWTAGQVVANFRKHGMSPPGFGFF
jgi:hypothetical protein